MDEFISTILSTLEQGSSRSVVKKRGKFKKVMAKRCTQGVLTVPKTATKSPERLAEWLRQRAASFKKRCKGDWAGGVGGQRIYRFLGRRVVAREEDAVDAIADCLAEMARFERPGRPIVT